MRPRAAPMIAWGSSALYAVLISTGLTLQAVSHVPADPVGGLEWLAVTSIAFLASSVIGSLIASRRPANPIGWIVCGLALVWAIEHFAFGYAAYALVAHPGSLPAGIPMALLHNTIFFVAEFGIVLLFLLFPSGRLPSLRWRAVVWTAVGALAVLLSLTPFDPDGLEKLGLENPWGARGVVAAVGLALVMIAFFALFAILIASVVSLVVRLRGARGEERQQLKWLAYAASFLPIGFGFVFFGTGTTPHVIGIVFLAVALIGFPLACAVAIFRYRLYDIDLVISKTVVALSLAGFITAVYVGVVVGLGRVLGTRGKPDLGLSILATALVAVAFQPVRERVQRLANRLVYGKRATPYEVLASFAKAVAGTYPAEDLMDRMARTLAEGTGSARAEVWLTVGQELHRRAAWPREPEGSAHLTLREGELPELPGATRAVPVHHQGELLGALALAKPPGEPLTPAEEALLSDLAAQAGLVLRNVGLIEDLKASRQRIVAAQDLERRRIERDIHDGAQQRLVTLSLAVRMARRGIGDDAALAGGLASAAEELKQTLGELRDLARGVHPAILTEEGLGPAVESLAERSPVPVRLTGIPTERLAEPVEATAYFVVSEALTNAAKHARASGVSVSVGRDDGRVIVEVVDDGVGGADTGGGTGLRGLADRVEAVGGRLLLESPPGHGTRLRVEVPCA